MNDKIAFINTHKHHINDNILNQLKRKFPDFYVENIDLVNLIKSDKKLLLVNAYKTLIEYGREIILRRKKFKECFFRTEYIFKRVKEILNDKINNKEFIFTFQSNSLFDGSTEDIPHFIYTDHTHLTNLTYPMFERKKLFPPEWLEREKSIYHNATKNFTYSSNIANSIIKDYKCSSDKVTCVYAGSNVPNDMEENFVKDYSKKIILFVGIGWERKGGPDLFEAFIEVKKNHPDSKLIVIGSSPEIEDENCEVLGKINVSQLGKYYSEASIFCMPTKIEPFGIVFLEAMMHKLPIVSTRIGALTDMVDEGKNGYLVEPGDSKSLAKVLNNLLSNPDKCRRFGEVGYNIAKNKYTWDKVGERLRMQIQPYIENETV